MRIWIWLAALLLGDTLPHSMLARGFGATWTINAYNTVFLLAALGLHGRPRSFLRACRDGVSASRGIIVQLPFYAGIFGLIALIRSRSMSTPPSRVCSFPRVAPSG